MERERRVGRHSVVMVVVVVVDGGLVGRVVRKDEAGAAAIGRDRRCEAMPRMEGKRDDMAAA